MKRLLGNLLNFITNIISFILDALIGIVEFMVSIVTGVGRLIFTLLSAGGCLLIMIGGPLLLLNPVTLLTILFLIIFPILGTSFVSYIKYIKYMITEYLFDRADSLTKGRRAEYDTFNEYGNKYRRMQEERYRREQQQRQQEQQRQWEERFRQWNEYQQSQSRGYGGGYYSGGQGYGGQTYANPTSEFKTKFEKSCNILGISKDADKYQIKLAYRKKAKEYHPDINKSADATKMFQEINDAYEFLSDENIERYKTLQ